MSELEEAKRELMEFQKWARRVMFLVHERLPKRPVTLSFDELMDDIKHLRGFVDCMSEFEIGLLQST